MAWQLPQLLTPRRRRAGTQKELQHTSGMLVTMPQPSSVWVIYCYELAQRDKLRAQVTRVLPLLGFLRLRASLAGPWTLLQRSYSVGGCNHKLC